MEWDVVYHAKLIVTWGIKSRILFIYLFIYLFISFFFDDWPAVTSQKYYNDLQHLICYLGKRTLEYADIFGTRSQLAQSSLLMAVL